MRIGVSAAKGLCFGLDIPLIALPTLEVLANKIQTEAGCIVATLDARRMEVYSAVFDTNHQCIDPTTAKILNAESYADLLEIHAVFFVGNGAAKTQDLIITPMLILMISFHHQKKCAHCLIKNTKQKILKTWLILNLFI